MSDGLRERLAALAHRQWSGWMSYLFGKCRMNDDATLTIPAWAVERWQRQMNTSYFDLPEEEKDSDRKEADRILYLLGKETTVENHTDFEGWMILELFGHNMIAGFTSEQSIGGAAFIRVDVPEVDGQSGFTKFFNGSAVYAMTPTTEALATEAARRMAVRPVSPWVVPDSRKELPGPTVEQEEGRDKERDLPF
jgi:hypothetical protein